MKESRQEEPLSMEQQGSAEEDEIYQDVVSQLPFLNGFTQVVLGFQPPAGRPQGDIVAAVRKAVLRVVTHVPWLGGQVLAVPEKGMQKLAPWPSDAAGNDMVRVKDCTESAPSIAQLLRAGAPISMLDGNMLAPWPALPHPHGLKTPVPVMVLQLNFVRDGLILNLGTHHTIMDGCGIFQLIKFLITALEGDEFPATELEQANRDRRRVLPLIPRGEPVKDFSYMRKPPGYTWHTPASPARWCYFKLSLSAASALKRSTSSPSSGLVSENDAICAFCWQRICAARIARGMAPDTVSKFSRTLDGRAAMGIPFAYMGHMICHAVTRLPMGQVAAMSLSSLAQALRRDLNGVNTAWALRSYATFIAREPDRSALLYGGPHNTDTDIGASVSVVNMGDSRDKSASLPSSWGALGTFRFFRRPLLAVVPGSLTINPVENGAIPVLLCLPGDDLDILQKDRTWRQYMKHVG